MAIHQATRIRHGVCLLGRHAMRSGGIPRLCSTCIWWSTATVELYSRLMEWHVVDDRWLTFFDKPRRFSPHVRLPLKRRYRWTSLTQKRTAEQSCYHCSYQHRMPPPYTLRQLSLSLSPSSIQRRRTVGAFLGRRQRYLRIRHNYSLRLLLWFSWIVQIQNNNNKDNGIQSQLYAVLSFQRSLWRGSKALFVQWWFGWCSVFVESAWCVAEETRLWGVQF